MRVHTKAHPIEPEELMAYLDGELPPDSAARAMEHLGTCRECQILALEMRRMSERMMEWQVEVPDLSAPAQNGLVREPRGASSLVSMEARLGGSRGYCLVCRGSFVSASQQTRADPERAAGITARRGRIPAGSPIPITAGAAGAAGGGRKLFPIRTSQDFRQAGGAARFPFCRHAGGSADRPVRAGFHCRQRFRTMLATRFRRS